MGIFQQTLDSPDIRPPDTEYMIKYPAGYRNLGKDLASYGRPDINLIF